MIFLINKVCALIKTEGLNLNVFNMITGINESTILAKHLSYQCKYILDEIKCN